MKNVMTLSSDIRNAVQDHIHPMPKVTVHLSEADFDLFYSQVIGLTGLLPKYGTREFLFMGVTYTK